MLPDTYTFKARIVPVLVAALPLVLVAVVWQGGDLASWKALGSVVIACGGGVLAGQLGRIRGKRLEPGLFSRWGGKPTTRLLRRNGAAGPAAERWRRQLQALVPDVDFPAAEEEAEDQENSDAIYDVGVKVLIQQTRDRKRFSLVFEELCNYGMARNLLGIRPIGIGACVLALVMTVPRFWMNGGEDGGVFLPAVAIFIDFALIGLWLWVVRESWVESVANAYAERLLAALDDLADNHAA